MVLSIGDVMRRRMAHLSGSNMLAIVDNWQRIAGEELALHCCPVRVRSLPNGVKVLEIIALNNGFVLEIYHALSTIAKNTAEVMGWGGAVHVKIRDN